MKRTFVFPMVKKMASNSLYTVLMTQLKKSGITKTYALNNLFPYWWDDSLKKDDGSVTLLIMYLSDLIDVEIDKFWNEDTNPKDELISEAKFKKTIDKTDEDVQLASALAIKMGIWATKACKNDYFPLPINPLAIREEILANAKSKTVTLEGLLDYLWKNGIPVIYLADFPKGKDKKKPDALCSSVVGRPFIVLTRKDDDPAKQQFWLAHEAGHIAFNHLENEGTILDIDKNTQEENEANHFAYELNCGKIPENNWVCYNFNNFQSWVNSMASNYLIEPSVFAQTFAYKTDNQYLPLVNKHFRKKGAIDLVRKKMLEYLDENLIDREIWAGLLKMTGAYDLYYASADKEERICAIS